jgi:hypothetical protein
MKLDLVLCLATAAYAAPVPEDDCLFYPREVRMCVAEKLKRTGWTEGFYERNYAICSTKFGHTRQKLEQKNRDCIKKYKKQLTNKN